MKRILCYGDSNTWGCQPLTERFSEPGRFPRDKRWTGVLAQELGGEFEIVEEGLNGRTTVVDDPIEGYRNGKRYLPLCLKTHKPLDVVTILLGTNDLKKRFSLPPSDIAAGAGTLVDIVKKSDASRKDEPPTALLIAPPEISKISSFFEETFEGAKKKSQRLPKHYRQIAENRGCHFLDASEFIKPTSSDGIHFEEEDHRKLGKAVASKIRKIC